MEQVICNEFPENRAEGSEGEKRKGAESLKLSESRAFMN